MRVSGVICECDPFHAGHGLLFSHAREGADAVVAVMSEHFTQRGEAACLAPSVRARLLLHGGANMVLGLPFPFSASGGESFGSAGVSILSGLGVTDLWFGSECGDLALLREAERATSDAGFLRAYREATRSGEGTAAAYAACLRDRLGRDAPLSPNDLLAVSYLRAIRLCGGNLTPHTVKRRGSAFRSEETNGTAYPSATALRGLWRREGVGALSPFFDEIAMAWLENEDKAGLAPADGERLGAVFLAWLRTTDPASLDGIPALGGGIGRRLALVAREVTDTNELFVRAAVRCPDSRLRRGLLFAVTGVRETDLSAAPHFAPLLAADRIGCRYLALRRRSVGLPVVTKNAELPKDAPSERQQLLRERAAGLWSLCLPRPLPPADLLRERAYIAVEEDTDQTNTEP